MTVEREESTEDSADLLGLLPGHGRAREGRGSYCLALRTVRSRRTAGCSRRPRRLKSRSRGVARSEREGRRRRAGLRPERRRRSTGSRSHPSRLQGRGRRASAGRRAARPGRRSPRRRHAAQRAAGAQGRRAARRHLLHLRVAAERDRRRRRRCASRAATRSSFAAARKRSTRTPPCTAFWPTNWHVRTAGATPCNSSRRPTGEAVGHLLSMGRTDRPGDPARRQVADRARGGRSDDAGA